MNNDYLWDRSGSDAQIEQLEALLGGLAFRPDVAPQASSREAVFETARPRWFLKIGLGLAAASMASFVVFFVLLEFRNGRNSATATDIPASISEIRTSQPPPDGAFMKASTTRPRKRVPQKRPRRQSRFVSVPEEPPPLPVVTLTAEERDAYRQLMTALAITSDKLNIVRGKLDGTR